MTGVELPAQTADETTRDARAGSRRAPASVAGAEVAGVAGAAEAAAGLGARPAVVATTSRRVAVIAGASVPNGKCPRSIPLASTM